MSPQASSEILVKIEKIVSGGLGLARHEGRVIFVPFAAPGDFLKVRITSQEKNFATAEIVEIVESGSGRQTPPCPYYGRCGGCNLQHLETSVQLVQKDSIVHDNLMRLFAKKCGREAEVEAALRPIKPSPKSWRYRNRIQPNYDQGRLGFYERSSHHLIDIQDCLIAEESLGQALASVKKELIEKKSTAGRLEIRINQDLKTETFMMEDSPEGFGFAQVNRYQNEELIASVLSLASPNEHSRIFDLYGGSGNFTFPLSEKFNHPLISVELSTKLAKKMKAEIEKHRKQKQILSIAADVELYLKRTELKKDDVVLLDPPRIGASELTMRSLAFAGPKQIIYISCDPAALARDLERFYRFCGESQKRYKITQIQPFEMFPQTDHIETIVDLRIDS